MVGAEWPRIPPKVKFTALCAGKFTLERFRLPSPGSPADSTAWLVDGSWSKSG
jgi:hypothetical protein